MTAVTAKMAMPEWLRMKLIRPTPDDLLRKFGVAAPPVDPIAIARAMGVVVEEQPRLRWSGVVESDQGTARIIVRAGEVPWRKRFTVAHELGHLMLHQLGVQFRDETFSGNEQERQANAFAAALLMPLWTLEPFAMKYGADSSRIATIFNVSEQAMNIRLGNLVGRP